MTRLNVYFCRINYLIKHWFVDAFNFLECLSWIAAIMMLVDADTLLKLNAV